MNTDTAKKWLADRAFTAEDFVDERNFDSLARQIDRLMAEAEDSKLKIYQATVVSSNSCYVETLLVTAADEKAAHRLLCEHENREVRYTRPLKEIKIDLRVPTVVPYVGWGESESDYGSDDD